MGYVDEMLQQADELAHRRTMNRALQQIERDEKRRQLLQEADEWVQRYASRDGGDDGSS